MPSSMNHIHTYERSKRDKTVYRCAHPDCSHYDRRENLEGKRAHCKCGEEFIFTNKRPQRHFQYAVPKCDACRTSKASKVKIAAQELMTDILEQKTGEIPIVFTSPAKEVETILMEPSKEPLQFELIPVPGQGSLPLSDEDETDWT